MALKNFLVKGSYSNIHNILYDKHQRMLNFNLMVFKDENVEMENLISNMQFNLGIFDYRTVISITDSPPLVPEIGDKYLVGQAPTDAFAGYANHIAKWSQWENWTMTTLNGQVVNVADEAKYYLVTPDGAAETEKFGKREFDQAFSIDALSNVDSNVLSLIYGYLKTRPEFINVVDV